MIFASSIANEIAIIAGLANGAFLAPVGKKTKNINMVWITYALLTYFLFPVIVLIISVLTGYYKFNFLTTLSLFFTGCLYGYGIYLLTLSIKKIGIGIPLALNISLGIITGSFFSIIISGNFSKLVNNYILISYSLILIAIVFYAVGLSKRDNEEKKDWLHGLVFGAIGSLLCASQGAALSFYSDTIKQLGNSYIAQLIPWALIFFGSAFIFITCHFIEHKKQKKLIIKKIPVIWRAFVMFILQTSSVLIYTLANANTAEYSQEYLWGTFMVSIVISSTFFSYCKMEWKGSGFVANSCNFLAIMLLLSSVIILSTTMN
jgi:hypothetical protein